MDLKTSVQYEDFGAVGDGVTDDMEAICAAHNYANSHNLPVKTKPDAEYYIGPKALTAIIETDTDWSTTRFIIDDTAVENNKLPCFLVRSALQPFELPIRKLTKDQKYLDFHPKQACYVKVTNSNEKKFIRFGLNQNKGCAQTDCFILEKAGSITAPIDWNYEQITEAIACPIDEKILSVHGGIFTTIANRAESVYNYYSRGIDITRSNTIIDGITHYVIGEGTRGSPYRGFINARDCAHVTVRNGFFSGHKIYWTVGSANLPVMMGSYDLHADNVVNLTLRNCRMNHINDRTRWGVFASNFCKNIIVEDCVLSRLDAHMGVSGTYAVRNSRLGWQGLNAIGRGELILENTILYGRNVINLRTDYGSTWEGCVKITDCKWVLDDNGREASSIIGMYNNGMHDFGYTCHMPETIEINNLYIDDSALGQKPHEIYLFADPCSGEDKESLPSFEKRPYPYNICKRVTCRKITVVGQRAIRISKNEELFRDVEITIED
jgi:hypothetical protein